MFPLLRKTLLFPSCCSSSSSQVRTFLIRFPLFGFSSPSPPPPPPQYNELEEEEEEEEDKVRVSVWWDIDTCGAPSGVSFSKVMPSVMGALRTHGIKCPVDIHAYGNLSQLPEINQEVLFLTGIDLHHVPGGKKHAHRYFMDWVSKNPPPAHLFIISGERDYNFACTVNQLTMNSYNILLACPAKTSFDLCYSATIMWQWSLMLKGDFTGKHFMLPPYWYGDMKVPRENPFSAAEEPTSSQSAEIHKPSSDIKLGEVPESVSRQQPHCKQLKEDKVSVSVWWDFDYCGVPSGVSVSKIAPSITGALRTNGINGPIDFRAYGDVSHFSKFEQTTLSLTGIHLCNITDEMKKNRKRKKACDYLFLDLRDWVFNNPPPFHLFIICGDVSINGILMLHRLRMSNYNILVACPGRTYDVLRSATTIMWHWSSILKGEDLNGKHFNYPPDGPFDSWYGDSRVNLENPFSAADGPTSSQAEILEYIESGELSKVTLENPFSTVEESTYSQNAEIHEPSPDIQSSEVPESVSRQVKNNKQRDSTSTQKLHNEGKNMDRNVDGIPIISSSYVSSVDGDSKSFQSIPSQVVDGKSSFPKESNVHQPPNELQKTSLGSDKVLDVASSLLPQVQLPPNESDISKNSDNDIVGFEDVSPEILEKKTASQNPSTFNDYTVIENNDTANCEFGKAENKHENPARKKVDEVCRSPYSSPVDDSLVEEKRHDGSAETSSKSSTFFSWISTWWTLWKCSAKSDDLTAHEDVIQSRKPELFEDSKLSELNQTASHFEEPKSSELQQDVCHSGMPESFSKQGGSGS